MMIENWKYIILLAGVFGLGCCNQDQQNAMIFRYGCYRYTSISHVNSTSLPHNAPGTCLAFCQRRNLPTDYIYLQGTMCIYWNESPMKNKTTHDCVDRCPGHVSHFCGGSAQGVNAYKIDYFSNLNNATQCLVYECGFGYSSHDCFANYTTKRVCAYDISSGGSCSIIDNAAKKTWSETLATCNNQHISLQHTRNDVSAACVFCGAGGIGSGKFWVGAFGQWAPPPERCKPPIQYFAGIGIQLDRRTVYINCSKSIHYCHADGIWTSDIPKCATHQQKAMLFRYEAYSWKRHFKTFPTIYLITGSDKTGTKCSKQYNSSCYRYTSISHVNSTSLPHNAPGTCLAFCQRSNLPTDYIYLQGTMCICSNESPMKNKTTHDCVDRCPGHVSHFCGGSAQGVSAYKIDYFSNMYNVTQCLVYECGFGYSSHDCYANYTTKRVCAYDISGGGSCSIIDNTAKKTWSETLATCNNQHISLQHTRNDVSAACVFCGAGGIGSGKFWVGAFGQWAPPPERCNPTIQYFAGIGIQLDRRTVYINCSKSTHYCHADGIWTSDIPKCATHRPSETASQILVSEKKSTVQYASNSESTKVTPTEPSSKGVIIGACVSVILLLVVVCIVVAVVILKKKKKTKVSDDKQHGVISLSGGGEKVDFKKNHTDTDHGYVVKGKGQQQYPLVQDERERQTFQNDCEMPKLKRLEADLHDPRLTIHGHRLHETNKTEDDKASDELDGVILTLVYSRY